MAGFRVLIRTGDGEWQKVETTGYTNETELQDLLAESPFLIPIHEIMPDEQPFVSALKEVTLEGNSADLLLVNEHGTLAIVECKLGKSPEAKRAVVGQILEYAGALWQMSYDDLDSLWRDRKEMGLLDDMGEQVPPSQWDEASFREAVETNLTTGKFILIIAVDEIRPELARTVEYINSTQQTGFRLATLELRYLKHGDVSLLIPHLTGPVLEPRPWARTEAAFRVSCSMNHYGAAIFQLYEFARSKLDKVQWGAGRTPGFSARISVDGRQATLFSVYSDGTIEIRRAIIQEQIGAEACGTFISKLRQQEGFQRLREDTPCPQVVIHTSTSKPREAADAFCKLFAELVDKIRGLPKNATGG